MYLDHEQCCKFTICAFLYFFFFTFWLDVCVYVLMCVNLNDDEEDYKMKTFSSFLICTSYFTRRISSISSFLYMCVVVVVPVKNRAREVKLNLFENSIWHLRRISSHIYNNKCWDHNKNTLNWFSHLALSHSFAEWV